MREALVRIAILGMGALLMMNVACAERFEGTYFAGEADADYLQLLNTAYRMFYPDPELQNISMLYNPTWNGFVEGPTWGAWWIQNSYGPTYCALPFFLEPYTTFLQNAQDLWFNLMGNGERKGDRGFVAPDGCLCDAATPTSIYYRQGDGKVDIHDWGMEFTAAGIVMQSELLLISRDKNAISHYLPMLERSANFIETRRDPKNNLFLAGPAGNLLAPSYAGYKKPDGTYDKAYLTGLSITYIAGLDRLIELEKMMGNTDKIVLYEERRSLAVKGLPALMTDEGYYIKYLDPDGTKHGVYGAEKHGYFEAVCNHDAIAFRVVDGSQSRKIYEKMASIPGLRPHDLIITNCPGLDDMYEPPTSWLWQFGTWVNGGHWTTCEARMILAYYRVGAYDDARRAMKQILEFAKVFRTDNPLVDFGGKVYQPKEPINCTYDTWGAPAGLIRGLFEYLYKADKLILVPHIPPGITRLEQRFPIRFGAKRLYLSTLGNGPITAVMVNAQPWKSFDAQSVSLPYDQVPDQARVVIVMGNADAANQPPAPAEPATLEPAPPPGDKFWDIAVYASKTAGNTLPLHIGADSEGANRFVGDIRRARIFSRALSADEIAALAKNPEADLAADPARVADYAMDALNNGVVANRANAALPAKAVGELAAADKALRFTGKGHLEIPHDAKLALKDAYTLDAWICPKALPATGARILDKIKAGQENGYLLDTAPGNSLRFITEQGTLSFDAKLEPDKWAHVAATFDSKDGFHLFINGKLVASGPAKKPAPPVSFAKIGAFYTALVKDGLAQCYEAQHAKLIVDYVSAIHAREASLAQGKLPALPEASQTAADRSYVEAADRLAQGLQNVLKGYEKSEEAHKKKVAAIWQEATK